MGSERQMNSFGAGSFGELLKFFRRRSRFTQENLAHAIGLSRRSIVDWESGSFLPKDRSLVLKLTEVLPLSKIEAVMLLQAAFPFQENSTQGHSTQLLTSILDMSLHIRILEEPLTAQNLNTIISALTELTTKYWLIAKGRFSDLIEYTQTRNGHFAEEAHIVITKISYNSPFNMDWKIDVSAPSVADALVTTIDGITQRQERLEKAKLENQVKAQEIKDAEKKSEMEHQMALLEQEKQRLELEQRRLEVLEKQLEVQKKGIEYALEIAQQVIDTLHPNADPATRAMEIQALLPNIIQLQSGKGLELTLPDQIQNAE